MAREESCCAVNKRFPGASSSVPLLSSRVKATLSHFKEVEDGYILLDVEHDG
jgi:hypothetical protein